MILPPSLEYRPNTDGICVANHTSPLDVVILSADRPYAMVGGARPGLAGGLHVVLCVSERALLSEIISSRMIS